MDELLKNDSVNNALTEVLGYSVDSDTLVSILKPILSSDRAAVFDTLNCLAIKPVVLDDAQFLIDFIAQIVNSEKPTLQPTVDTTDSSCRKSEICDQGEQSEDQAIQMISAASIDDVLKNISEISSTVRFRTKINTKKTRKNLINSTSDFIACDHSCRNHSFKANCLKCGRFNCTAESTDVCTFCATPLCLTFKNSTEYESAEVNKQQVLYLQSHPEAGQVIVDESFDVFTAANSIWLTEKERKCAINYMKTSFRGKANVDRLSFALDLNKLTCYEIDKRNMNSKTEFLNELNSVIGYSSIANSLANITISTDKLDIKSRDFSAKAVSSVDLPRYASVYDGDFTQNDDIFTSSATFLCPLKHVTLSNNIDENDPAFTGVCLSVIQPFATLAVSGLIDYIYVKYDVDIKGVVWIASDLSNKLVNKDTLKYLLSKIFKPSFLQSAEFKFAFGDSFEFGAILGCVNILEKEKVYRDWYKLKITNARLLNIAVESDLDFGISVIKPDLLHKIKFNLRQAQMYETSHLLL